MSPESPEFRSGSVLILDGTFADAGWLPSASNLRYHPCMKSVAAKDSALDALNDLPFPEGEGESTLIKTIGWISAGLEPSRSVYSSAASFVSAISSTAAPHTISIRTPATSRTWTSVWEFNRLRPTLNAKPFSTGPISHFGPLRAGNLYSALS